ncbi:MAG TPA: nucleotide exchange factor GrpE [Candidatus Binatia bacterium]|jgi:molecular chaperone GrpE|nr:nucleotide exchange factor GrpE [Candidatus Binatia bacterium]
MDEQQNTPAPEPAQQPAPETPGEDLQKKCEEYLAGWKRAMADYANLKKDMERERAELSRYAVAGFVEKLLPTVESFRKAAEHLPAEPYDAAKTKQWIDGVGHIRSQLDAALASAGIAAVDKDGVPFDPNLHDAMMMEKREGADPGTVLRVLEPGWRLHDRVIRPAKVVVAE